MVYLFRVPYYHASELIDDNFNNSGSVYMWDYEEFHSLKLGAPIKYAVNPATGLNLEDARAALYFFGCQGGAPADINLIEESIDVWRTPYMPLACLEEYSITWDEHFTGEANNPTYLSAHCATIPQLHLVLNFGTTIYAAMYRMRRVQAPYSFENTPENPFIGIPETATSDMLNDVLDGNVQAWSEILITEEIPVTNENVDFLNSLNPVQFEVVTVESDDPGVASYQQLVPTTKEYEVGHTARNFTLQNVPDCGEVLPVSQNYLNNFCKNTNKYNPIALRRIVPENEVNLNNSIHLEINPNPTSGELMLSFILKSDDFVTGKIFNLLGQKIDIPINNQLFSKGENFHSIDISSLPTATYILELTTSTGRQIEKIVKK